MNCITRAGFHAGGQPHASQPYTCRYARTVAGGGGPSPRRAHAHSPRSSARNCSTLARRFCASSSATAACDTEYVAAAFVHVVRACELDDPDLREVVHGKLYTKSARRDIQMVPM
jgi:hypothetical protein